LVKKLVGFPSLDVWHIVFEREKGNPEQCEQKDAE